MSDSKRTIVAAGPGFAVWAEGDKTTIELDHSPAYTEPMPEKRGPHESVKQWYKPVEKPPRWPLELRAMANGVPEILLWSGDGKHAWVIARWRWGGEGADRYWIGSRPLDPRVNWTHFRELVATGQRIAEELRKQQMVVNPS